MRLVLAIPLLVLGLIGVAQAAPLAPTGLRGTVLTSNSLALIWDDNSTDETHFEIAYSIIGGSSGAFPITVSATDVDGNTTQQVIAVQVQQTFAQWIATQGVPGGQTSAAANPDFDGLNNVQEFAFFGNPNIPDSALHLPTFNRTAVGPSFFAEITFPVRKFAANLVYTAEVSSSLLPGSWTTLWSSADGVGAPVVSSVQDQADRTIMTVRDTVENPARRFLRVRVE